MELSRYLRAVSALTFCDLCTHLGVVGTGAGRSMWENSLGFNAFSGNRSHGSHLLSSCSMLGSLNAFSFNEIVPTSL